MVTPAVTLLERTAELAVLQGLCDGLVGGAGSAIALVGLAGIGKTSLVGEVTALGRASGLEIMPARGGRLEQDLAFAGVRQLFSSLLRSHPDVLAAAAPPAARLLSRQHADGGAPPDQALLFQGLVWLLSDVAERQPLLLVADDAHWLDVPTLRFLGFLARRLPELPISLVIATRPPEGATAQVLADLLDDPSIRLVHPAPLSLDGVQRLIRQRYAVEPAPEFTLACAAAAGGNPFLTGELLGALVDGQVLPDATGARAVGAEGVPRLRADVANRLRRLDPDAELLARTVAVLGHSADTHTAGQVAGLAAAAVSTGADALAAAGLLTGGRPLAFAHPLVRQAVYDGIPAGARSLAHRRVAELLAARSARPDVIASHLLSTDAAGDAWAVDRLEAAAEETAADGAPEMAVPFLLRALEEPPPPGRGRVLIRRAGELAARAGLPSAVPLLQSAFEAARLAGDHAERLLLSNVLRGAILEASSDPEAAIAPAVQVYDEAKDPASRLVALSGLALAGLLLDGDNALNPYVDAFLTTVDLDTPGLPAPLLGLRAFAGTSAGEHVTELVAAGLRALQLHERDSPGTSEPWQFHAAGALLFAGHVGARDMAEREFARARSTGDSVTACVALNFRAWWHVHHGDLAAAEADAGLAIDLFGLRPHAFYVAGLVGALTEVLVARGDLAHAQDMLARHGLEGDCAPSLYASMLLEARAHLRAAQGRRAEAMDDLRLIGLRAALVHRPNPGMFSWRSGLALLLRTTGRDDEEARALADEGLRLALAYGAPRPVAIARRAVALVTDDPGLLAVALADFRQADDRLGIAETLIDLGSMQRRAGADHAADTLRLGLDEAAAIGAASAVARARGELSLTGSRPQRNRIFGTEALTPAELRTARLAANGASNREIAQAAYLSLKTVETQLAAAYRKLDCGGRPGLTAALARTTLEYA